MTTKHDITRVRLVNQLMVKSSASTAADVVRHLGAIQAQDYAGGEWSIGLRLPGSRLIDIENAIAAGMIVRTWGLRGTLHFLAGADIRWVLELLTPGIIARIARRYKELELDPAVLRRTNSILAKELMGNRQLTRGELRAMIEKKGISCEGQRMTFILHRASLDRVICFGVTRVKQQTHTLFDEMVPETRRKSREESLAELARRYFISHGPAAIQDYMWWSGLSAADARAGLEAVKSELVSDNTAGNTLWMSPETFAPKSNRPAVHLLPPFDDFLLGYKDRSASIDRAVAGKLRGGGMPESTIMIDGRIVGTWRKMPENRVVRIARKEFRVFDAREKRLLEEATKRYADFVGKERRESSSVTLPPS